MINSDAAIEPVAQKGAAPASSAPLLFYVAVGLRFERIPDRQSLRALLCFGPFPTHTEAKEYLVKIGRVVNGGAAQTVTIAKMAGVDGGEPEDVVKTQPLLSFVGGRGHDQRAIAQLTPEGLQWYLKRNGIGEVIAPYEVDVKGKPQQNPLGLLPYYIMRTLDRHYGLRRVI